MQQVHEIGLAIYSCANDNNRVYPTGNSSTEVCQKLLDGGYVTDPALFYFPYAGKTAARPGQRLKPENVCFDFTDGATMDSFGELPLVFLSGYRITYAPGTGAIPRFHPMPYEESWLHRWFNNGMDENGPVSGSAVYFVDNSVKWLPDRYSSRFKSLDDLIPNFIPPDFKSDGKTYRQLTPDGVLAP